MVAKGKDESFVRPEKKKGGRPRKPLDLQLVTRMAEVGCSEEDIAYVCNVDARTIRRRAAEEIRRGHAKLRWSVRKAQVDLALKRHDRVMLIWLGKQLLGQHEPNVAATQAHDDQRERIAGITPEELLRELHRWDTRQSRTSSDGSGNHD